MTKWTNLTSVLAAIVNSAVVVARLTFLAGLFFIAYSTLTYEQVWFPVRLLLVTLYIASAAVWAVTWFSRGDNVSREALRIDAAGNKAGEGRAAEIEAIKREFRYITNEQAISILKVREGNQDSVRKGLGEWRTKLSPHKASQSAQPKVASVAIEREHPASRPTQNLNQPDIVSSTTHRPRPGIKERDTQRRIKNRKGKLRSEAYSHFREERRYQKQRRVTPNCPYCGCIMPAVLTDRVELDHIYPVSSGGENLNRNLVFVCKECNQAKSNQGLIEFCSNTGKNINSVSKILHELGKKV